MWRCPDKYNQKQQQSLRIQTAGNRSPAQDWRGGTGGTANHDVLRCSPFQPDGIHDRVTD